MKVNKINEHSIANSAYASVLQHIPTPPKVLYIKGELPARRLPTVAIVGSRKPTAYGIEVTQRLATELARSGVVIVSGLAYGIDAVAHQAALDAGGITIAILANGLHRVYPVAHKSLAASIVQQGGALVSELPMGAEAHRYHFLARNRLVSGLADAVIVTEATERSGTLSTVAHALEQNKEVFAVPGPITSLLSAGPNRLLQQGAHVALSAQAILDVIAPQMKPQQTALALGYTEHETALLALLQQGIHDGAELEAKLAISASEFFQALTMLELRGTIKRSEGNRWLVV